MLLKEMVLKIKPNQKWTCMKPQLMLSWLTDYNQRLRGVAIAVMPSTPLMKNRNRSLLDLIKEHYFCMFIYYHWVNTTVGGFVSSEVFP